MSPCVPDVDDDSLFVVCQDEGPCLCFRFFNAFLSNRKNKRLKRGTLIASFAQQRLYANPFEQQRLYANAFEQQRLYANNPQRNTISKEPESSEADACAQHFRNPD